MPQILSITTFVAGVILIVSGVTPAVRSRFTALDAVLPLGVMELSHFAAEEKDKGIRCDVEAGMAKLLAARVAWSNADNGLQIHGGNGYALEFEISRVLCDARILNIFEGAAEIQAQVIGRGLLLSRSAPDDPP